MTTENRENNRGNVANLAPHQFKPGESGNPGGRPKKLAITDRIVDQLAKRIPENMRTKLPSAFWELYGQDATLGEALAFELITRASQGDMRAMAILIERVEGKVAQNMAHSGADAEPVVFRVIRVNV